MSVLNPTSCGESCDFSQLNTYCFDCPSLMCSVCAKKSHSLSSHRVMTFKNTKLDWQDKSIITSLFLDVQLGSGVFEEVSRNIECAPVDCSNNSSVPLPDYSFSEWSCGNCSFTNNEQSRQCFSCGNFRDDECMEYEDKLQTAQSFLMNFIDIDKSPYVPYEHCLTNYLSSRYEKNIKDWYKNSYLNGRNEKLIFDIVAKEGFRITVGKLNDIYENRVSEENKKFVKAVPFVNQNLGNSKSLISADDINKMNKGLETFETKKQTNESLWPIISGKQPYSDRIRRMIMTEMLFPSADKVELLRNAILDESLNEFLTEDSPLETAKLSYLRQAILEQYTIHDVSYFLCRGCQLCCGTYPMPEMHAMMTCSHEFCKNCIMSYLTTVITGLYPCKWSCPVCDDNQMTEIDLSLHYCDIRNIIASDKTLTNIFEEKLLCDRLRQSENFHWCSNKQCVNGFEAEAYEKIECPKCETMMCVRCNRTWDPKHANVSCQEFELWLLQNDPNLSKLLNDIGIECPTCGMRFALAPGGCLHFDCRACPTRFCGGCYEIYLDQNCGRDGCTFTGFHSHHPRNCLYYLRDCSVNELENMLKNQNFEKPKNPENVQNCQILITRDRTMIDEPCNAAVHAGAPYCEVHYKEYLVQFINRFKVDPADFADCDQLNLMLFQGILPKLVKNGNENENEFKQRLLKEVKEKCKFYIPKGLQIDVVPDVGNINLEGEAELEVYD